jgi:hypothetical protein
VKAGSNEETVPPVLLAERARIMDVQALITESEKILSRGRAEFAAHVRVQRMSTTDTGDRENGLFVLKQLLEVRVLSGRDVFQDATVKFHKPDHIRSRVYEIKIKAVAGLIDVDPSQNVGEKTYLTQKPDER